MLSCLHTHTNYCDGAADIETMCQAAYDKGLVSLGFSSHAPVPLLSEWHMKKADLSAYLAEVREAAERWAGRLEIWTGLEIDYIEKLSSPADSFYDSLALDYRIGSVHYLRQGAGQQSEDFFTVDGSEKELEEGLQHGFAGNSEKLIQAYWEAVAKMLSAGGLTIVGHLDLIRKYNQDDAFFTDTSKAWQDGAAEALRAAAKSGVIIEINTGGMNRGIMRSPYPNLELIKEMKKLHIPVMINADAHKPEHLGGYYETARDTLVNAGYTESIILKDGKLRAIPL
jgi:histidinol-phosphatase (PHP family)